MLRDVAFGPAPGRYPLPVSDDPRERWLRAVALGGQGRYAQARSELDVLDRSAAPTAVLSLAASTRASLLRQSGAHTVASGYDGLAFALVGPGSPAPGDDPLVHEARCDALTGLAADALGSGRTALGRRLLAHCAEYLETVGSLGTAGGLEGSDALWRQHVRLDWVTAEIALASGDFGAATKHSQAAVERSAEHPSVRHRIKSELLLAAAATGGPDPEFAVETVGRVLSESERHGLLPLRWAAAMLLNGLRPTPDVRAVRDECAAVIAGRGGRFV